MTDHQHPEVSEEVGPPLSISYCTKCGFSPGQRVGDMGCEHDTIVASIVPKAALSSEREKREAVEAELGALEDQFERCDNCDRLVLERDLETIWCRDASGEQVDARICPVCRLDSAREEERERIAEVIKAKRNGAEAHVGSPSETINLRARHLVESCDDLLAALKPNGAEGVGDGAGAGLAGDKSGPGRAQHDQATGRSRQSPPAASVDSVTTEEQGGDADDHRRGNSPEERQPVTGGGLEDGSAPGNLRPRSIELVEPLPAFGAANDQEGVTWLTCNGLPVLNLTLVFKRVVGLPDEQGAEGEEQVIALVDWPDVNAGHGKRLERFVLAIEYSVWECADLDRKALLEQIFEALPVVVADGRDEAAELQQAEVARLSIEPSSETTTNPGGEDG